MPHYDEDEPKKPMAWTVGEDLSTLSIDELTERIEILKDEIQRIEATMAAKRTSIDVADTFFKR